MEKNINRSTTSSNTIFDSRTLEKDYRTLVPLLKKGMRVLDIGCGTGAISKDIARAISPEGCIIGIDNTEAFIESGRQSYCEVDNLELIYADLYEFNPYEKFDLIVSARTFQWLTDVDKALRKVKDLLKPGGLLSILDYDHTKIEWEPEPPESMQEFYGAFLQWREDAGMSNKMAEELPGILEKNGFKNIEVHIADEKFERGQEHFKQEAGIWSKVAGLKQIVEEGYISEHQRLKAIEEYDLWVEEGAVSMTLKLSEVRGVL